MRRALVVAALAALVLPSLADAHVTVLPTFLEAGQRTTLVFTAPNERAPHAVTGFTVTFPRDVALSAPSPPADWQVDIAPGNARWSQGRIDPGQIGEFRIDAKTDLAPGPTTLYAVQRYDDGKSVRWELPFTLAPGSTSPGQHIWPAFIATIVGIVVIVGGLLLIRRRRPSTAKPNAS